MRMNLVIKSEYEPFNKKSKFFTDICTQFYSEDNIDVPLDDRKNDYFIKLVVCDSVNKNIIYYTYIHLIRIMNYIFNVNFVL